MIPASRALRWLAVLLAATWSLSENCTGRAESNPPLPRIRLAADGRGFESETGRPFVPFGVNYFRPGTGWAPELWRQFDAEATRQDFTRMKELGVNCVRVFLSFGSFLNHTNQLSPEGLARFDQFLRLAEKAGIYVHPTGPDHWEGLPEWARTDRYADETVLQALEIFWKQFAARYRGWTVVFAYDLLNEPEIRWDTPPMQIRWARWLEETYRDLPALARAWGLSNPPPSFATIAPPPREDCAGCAPLRDYQRFRESVADEWMRRQVAAIRSADPQALVTVGLIQWSVPLHLAGPWHYSGVRPDRAARWVDFLSIHFYPLAGSAYGYRDATEEARNLAYLEAVVREVARPGKPVVLGEFGWYGGGKLQHTDLPAATEEQQARWCAQVVTNTAGWVTGWLNWGLYDHPEARDCSELTGLLTVTGRVKAWGREFQALARQLAHRRFAAPAWGSRPQLDWEACLTSTVAGRAHAQRYFEAWQLERQTPQSGTPPTSP